MLYFIWNKDFRVLTEHAFLVGSGHRHGGQGHGVGPERGGAQEGVTDVSLCGVKSQGYTSSMNQIFLPIAPCVAPPCVGPPAHIRMHNHTFIG